MRGPATSASPIRRRRGPIDLVFVRGVTGDHLSTWKQPWLARHVPGLAENGRRLTAAVLIAVDDELVIERLTGRRQCSNGHLYHETFDPPKNDGYCDQCGKPLRQREDDKRETIEKRLATYHGLTEPVIDYYQERSMLQRFGGSRSPDEVHNLIRATLASLRLEEKL